MGQVIVFTNEDGGVSVCIPTSEMSIFAVQKQHIPQGVESYIVDNESLPYADNDFFNAWEQTNGVVTVNFDKAKEITKQRLRFERIPLLAAQDVAFQRALETGADTSAIVSEKQRLRDVTLLVNSCQSLHELRTLSV